MTEEEALLRQEALLHAFKRCLWVERSVSVGRDATMDPSEVRVWCDGMGSDGLGWDRIGSDRMGCDRMGWDGMEWNGIGWVRMGWG